MKVPIAFGLLSWTSFLSAEQQKAEALVPSPIARGRLSSAPTSSSSAAAPAARHSVGPPLFAKSDVPSPKRKRSVLSLNFIPDIPNSDKEEDDVTAGNSAGTPSDSNAVVERKVAGRKRRLYLSYYISSFVYLSASLAYLFRCGVHSWSLYDVFGGGTFTMGAALYILKGAASHDRLSSDTYKRLNLTVITAASLQLLLPVGVWTFSERLFITGPALLALISAIKGYGYGVLGWDKSVKENGAIVTDLKAGIQSTLRCLTVVKAESVGYLFGIFLLGLTSAGKCWGLGSSLLFSPGREGAALSMMVHSRLSQLARLCFLTSVLYTLKDAADRDRLNGTTFVQLNYVSGVAFATMAAYCYLVPVATGRPSSGTSAVSAALIWAAASAGGLSVYAFVKGGTNGIKDKGETKRLRIIRSRGVDGQ